MADGARHVQPMPSRVAATNVETYIACSLAGMGLIQIPAFDVREHLEAGALVEVLPEWPAPSMPIQIVYPHRRHLSPRVRTFCHWLADIVTRECLERQVPADEA